MHNDPILLRLLAQIDDLPFSKPVTAYLVDAFIRGSSCYGVTYRHVRAEPNGRFADGHFMHTSAIIKVGREGPFSVLHTVTGSFYVILSFNLVRGTESWEDYQQRLNQRHPEPWQLH